VTALGGGAARSRHCATLHYRTDGPFAGGRDGPIGSDRAYLNTGRQRRSRVRGLRFRQWITSIHIQSEARSPLLAGCVEQVRAPQRLHKKESERRDMKLHGPRLEFPVVQQVRLILKQVGLIQLVWRSVEVFRKTARWPSGSTERWSSRSYVARARRASLGGAGSQEPPCDPQPTQTTRPVERASRGASAAPAASFQRRNVDREFQLVRPPALRRGEIS
jgi:hypothetical protein